MTFSPVMLSTFLWAYWPFLDFPLQNVYSSLFPFLNWTILSLLIGGVCYIFRKQKRSLVRKQKKIYASQIFPLSSVACLFIFSMFFMSVSFKFWRSSISLFLWLVLFCVVSKNVCLRQGCKYILLYFVLEIL